MNRSTATRQHRKHVIFVLSFAIIVFMAKAYYDTNTVQIKHYQIKNSPVGEALQGLKIAHLSDLHIKHYGPREKKILRILEEEKPDLIFLTGDYIQFEGPYAPMMHFFSQLRASFGVYAVLGNAEYSNENGSCILCHEERSKNLKTPTNVTFLRNALARLEVNGKALNIIGVDDPVEKRSDLKTILSRINSREPSILLAHSPELFEQASSEGIDFLLCGHTHGGQIFITKYLGKVVPLEAALNFVEGFFHEGKTLMYVTRGIGTSFLPFRLGEKPEITFFTFSNNPTNSTNPSNPINPSNPSNPSNSINTSNPSNSVLISNNPPKTIFTGLNLSSVIETFNVLKVFDSLGLTSTPQKSSAATPQDSSTAGRDVLYDFESETDLEKLNWQCGKWFEFSKEHSTSGRQSLKMILPVEQYPGIDFRETKEDWSKKDYLRMDVFNPSEEDLTFHVRIDDNKSGWDYGDRFDTDFNLKNGINPISIPMESIRTNINSRPLNLRSIKRMMVFIPHNTRKVELYIDNIRLE